ncbi:MAG: phosphoglycerate mutase, partial [Deltaproteobacteria bacterium]
EYLEDEQFEFHPGVSYRHLMVWRGGCDTMACVPPHDITNQCVGDYLPTGEGADTLIHLMTQAQIVLKNQSYNLLREERGEVTANSIWLWGQGRAPEMPTLKERAGLDGAVISAVDLIKGIGIYAGLDVVEVEGATGYIDTNYRGKAEAALNALETGDFVYLHVEAPDEAAHAGNLEDKIRAIEDFDREIVGRILKGLEGESFRMLVLPDHPTPVARRTHTADPVPFVLYDSCREEAGPGAYSERAATATNVWFSSGASLFDVLVAAQGRS